MRDPQGSLGSAPRPAQHHLQNMSVRKKEEYAFKVFEVIFLSLKKINSSTPSENSEILALKVTSFGSSH